MEIARRWGFKISKFTPLKISIHIADETVTSVISGLLIALEYIYNKDEIYENHDFFLILLILFDIIFITKAI